MLDRDTAELLRSVLNELCAQLPASDNGTKVNVAAKLLDAVRQGRSSPGDLLAAGREALPRGPTMWR